jgi:NAD-dependent SIR2 family protein deacetylase
MPICQSCKQEFPNWIVINGEKKNLSSRKYCLDCSPYNNHNTKQLNNNIKPKQKRYCKQCGKELIRHDVIFCGLECHSRFQYEQYIEKWKRHEVSGIRGKNGQLSNYVRRYVFEKFHSKCSKCGWGEINPYTNTIPLEVEHIDGNWENSYEENLNLLCPNCHSLTSTYRGANRGHGRNITWIVKEQNNEAL